MITKAVIVSASQGLMILFAGALLMVPTAHAQECPAERERISALEAQIQQLFGELGRVPPVPSEIASPTRIAHGANGQETVFTRDTSIAALGEAWRDPSGMIWGDIVRNANGSIRHMDHYQATAYCQSLGAQLPSREDFVRLREYMGTTTSARYYFGTGYPPPGAPEPHVGRRWRDLQQLFLVLVGSPRLFQ